MPMEANHEGFLLVRALLEICGFFDILFTSKYMELMSQLKIFLFSVDKNSNFKKPASQVDYMMFVYLLSQAYDNGF